MAWPSEAGAVAFNRAAQARLLRRRRSFSRNMSAAWYSSFSKGFDGLRIFGSGAASDGGAQAVEGANLGNFRSSTEWASLAVFGAMKNITIQRVGEGNEPGVGALESDGAGYIRWRAPGSVTPGAYTFIGDGQTIVLEDGEDSSKSLRVSRSGTAPIAGAAAIQLLEMYNNAFGQDNVVNAERAAGANQYRCFMLKNLSVGPIDLSIYLKQLGTPRLSGAYASAGAVTITITVGTLDDWPLSGFVENQDVGEVLYYTARSIVSPWTLTVPAAGRDIYAEVGGGVAGLTTHTLYPIPGLRLAFEEPSSQPSGFVQTIANESTSPTGRTWVHPVSDSDSAALSRLALQSNQQIGLWLHRKVIAAATARAQVQNQFVIDHIADSY